MSLWVKAADLVVPCEDIKVCRQAVIGPFSRAAPRIGVHTSAPALLISSTEYCKTKFSLQGDWWSSHRDG